MVGLLYSGYPGGAAQTNLAPGRVDASVDSTGNPIPREGLRSLRERELQRFAELRPRGMRMLEEARRSMPNGVPMSWMASL